MKHVLPRLCCFFFALGTPWGTSGQPVPQLVADIRPGPASSEPQYFQAFDSALYFAAQGGNGVFGLWRSTGGAGNGPQLVKDSVGPFQGSIVPAAGAFYFTTFSNGGQLWKSDGTPAGTSPVSPLSIPGFTASGQPALLAGKLYFSGDDGSTGRELWATDGTAAGTVLVKDINPGAASSRIQALAVWNGRFYFAAFTAATGYELWSTDGTAAGTALLANAYPDYPGVNNDPPSLVGVFNNRLYYAASDSVHGRELWSTDGTAAGTGMVTDANPGDFDHAPSPMTVYKGRMYYVGEHTAYGAELWASDGTAAGTGLVCNIFPYQTSGMYSAQMAVLNGRLYFTARNATDGFEPWSTDGTAAGTAMLFDLLSGPGIGSAPGSYCLHDGWLYFSAYDGSGRQLYRTDGTLAGLSLVTVPAPSADPLGSRRPLCSMAGTLYFAAAYDEDATGEELYRIAGGTAGVSPEPVPQPPVAYPNPAGTVLHLVLDGRTTYRCTLQDACGRTVLEAALKTGAAVLDVAALQAGTYFLTVAAPERRSWTQPVTICR